MVGAVKGYQVIITMPEKMSHEKQVVLEALGAKFIARLLKQLGFTRKSYFPCKKAAARNSTFAHIRSI